MSTTFIEVNPMNVSLFTFLLELKKTNTSPPQSLQTSNNIVGEYHPWPATVRMTENL
jgi:hypothetical protein